MLPRVAATTKSAKEKFEREIANTQALKHPNVVRVREAGPAHGVFFFTVEYCDGGSVDKVMEARKRVLTVDEAMAIILPALDGLEYAHHAHIPYVKLADGTIGQGKGLVHRDLKPHNLFLSGSGRSQVVKIGDYGLSKAFDFAGMSGLTATGEAAGSPWFMPRQQVVNFKYAMPEVDVWAMAASLYFMLTGAYPRNFPEDQDRWEIVLTTSAVPIRRRDPSIPRKLADVIDAALVDKPGIGIRSAAALKKALEDAL
jgi:serine/threonine protein kinase